MPLRLPQRTDAVTAAIAAVAAGEIVVVVDDEDRENEGDLIMAADTATPEQLAFMVRHTSGVVCVSLEAPRCDRLELPLMVPPTDNREAKGTAFTVSVDVREGTTTGISSADRAATVRALADAGSLAVDFNRPGHIFPLRARPGGVLERPGHTEAAVDLARLAGRAPAGVLCEVVLDGGGMARLPELTAFAERHGLVLVSIRELIAYRRRTEKLVARLGESRLPTRWGDFHCVAFGSTLDANTHLAFVMGDPVRARDVLVRVHSECLTGDVFGSRRCDCGPQLEEAMRRIAEVSTGAVVYLRGHEGRGIGLAHKLRAYQLQEQGFDTVDANVELGLPVDDRDYSVGAQILADLGVTTMRLMTNNPVKYRGLEEFGLHITERVPLLIPAHADNVAYLRTKRERLGHLLPGLPDGDELHALLAGGC